MVLGTVGFGIDAIDSALGGLIEGDNVVCINDRDDTYVELETAFITNTAPGRPLLWLATGRGEPRHAAASHLEVIGAAAGSRLSRPTVLLDALDTWMRSHPPANIVVDGLATLARRWGVDEAVAFFSRACPLMLQHHAVTLWRVPRSLPAPAVERIRQVTQVLIDLDHHRLRVLKAEGRSAGIHASTFRIRRDDGGLVLERDPAAGRLARGLVSVRRDLGLTQAQLAEAGGVTPSAISQAESGGRGLSLETLIGMSDHLDVSLDRLVAGNPRPGYRLARHDRSRVLPSGVIALADDASTGLRAYLVTLDADQRGAPPIRHDGTQLIAVTRGLVEIEVGGDTPVLRAGDTIVASPSPVTAWQSIGREPAVFFWALRD